MLDPVSQMNRLMAQLSWWLNVNKFPNIPLMPLIIISNPNTIIETTTNPKYFKQITHSINIEKKIEAFRHMHKIELYSKKN
ncbi:hypothetical protein ACI2OX_01990 [Bacillus sp. N9]